MALDQVKSFFSDSIESIIPTINENLKSVTGNEVEASFGGITDSGAENYLGENALPFIAIDISDEVTGCVHQAVISGENAQAVSVFFGDAIEGELADSHLNLFQESVDKLLGTFSEGGFKISHAELVSESDNLNLADNFLSQKLILRKGDETAELNLYHWESMDSDSSSSITPQPADFTAFGDSNGSASTPNKIDMLLDVELEVTVELGRKKMPIQEVLQLGKGSVVELSKLAGEPVDIYVNQRKLAEGEVVVVDENFAIRITSLVEHSERLKSLG